MIAGSILGVIGFGLDFFQADIVSHLPAGSSLASGFKWITDHVLADFMLTAFVMCCICMAIQIVASLARPEPLKQEARLLVWDGWTEPLRGMTGGRGLANYRVLSGVVVAAFVVLYWVFR